MKGENTKRWYYSSFLAPSPRLHLGVVCFSLRETGPFSANLSERHIFIHVAMLWDHFQPQGHYCFPEIGTMILAAMAECQSWKGPQPSSQCPCLADENAEAGEVNRLARDAPAHQRPSPAWVLILPALDKWCRIMSQRPSSPPPRKRLVLSGFALRSLLLPRQNE